MTKLDKFNIGDKIIYPNHGLGFIKEITKQTFGEQEIEFLVLVFEKNRMTIRIPTNKIETSGLRKISSEADMKKIEKTIGQAPKVKKMMWAKRSAEYESKINSGDVAALAEVVRDLSKNANSESQSYSEARIYEDALERLSEEYAEVFGIPSDLAEEKLESIMKKNKSKKASKEGLSEDEAELKEEIEELSKEIDKLKI